LKIGNDGGIIGFQIGFLQYFSFPKILFFEKKLHFWTVVLKTSENLCGLFTKTFENAEAPKLASYIFVLFAGTAKIVKNHVDNLKILSEQIVKMSLTRSFLQSDRELFSWQNHFIILNFNI